MSKPRKAIAGRLLAHWGDSRLPDRFWGKTIPEPNSGCWLWTASVVKRGEYGHFSVNGRMRAAHIVAFEALVGVIPVGLELDHLCRTPLCCNPAHVDPVTHRVNCQRGDAGIPTGQQHRAKTHCPKGHPYDQVNTIVRPREWRDCRECRNARQRYARLAKAVRR